MQKAISIFANSAGALLLAMATALFLIIWTNARDCVPPHDPIFLISLNDVFSFIGGITAVAASICLFSERRTLPAYLVLWIAYNYVVYRIALCFVGSHGLNGYLVGFSHAFGISAHASATTANVIFAYLFTGSCVVICFARRLPPPVEYQKAACPSCGGRVKFSIERLDQTISCPHCRAPVKLRRSEELLRMRCFFCKEHIEFPAYALGQKIKCPHCKMGIGLKEETI